MIPNSKWHWVSNLVQFRPFAYSVHDIEHDQCCSWEKWPFTTYWNSIGLEIRMHEHYTHTQRHMNNAWNEMVILTPCLALNCSFSTWSSQTIWDINSPTTDRPGMLITILFFLILHFYETSNLKLHLASLLPISSNGHNKATPYGIQKLDLVPVRCGKGPMQWWVAVERFGMR